MLEHLPQIYLREVTIDHSLEQVGSELDRQAYLRLLFAFRTRIDGSNSFI